MINEEQREKLDRIGRTLTDLIRELPHRTEISDTMHEFSHELNQYFSGRLHHGVNEMIEFYSRKIEQYEKHRM